MFHNISYSMKVRKRNNSKENLRTRQAVLLVGNPGWQLVANNTQPAIDLVIPNQLYNDLAFRDFSVFSPKKFFGGLAPIWVRRWKSPLSFGKSFMKIRSAVPKNGCLMFMHYCCGGRKKKQKTEKNRLGNLLLIYST